MKGRWILSTKLVVLSLALVMVAGIAFHPGTVRASAGGKVRVVLGNPDYAGPLHKWWYVGSRHSALEEVSQIDQTVRALVVFRNYHLPSDAEAVIGNGIRPLEVFLADPSPSSYGGGGVVLATGESIVAGALRWSIEAAELDGAERCQVVAVLVEGPGLALLELTNHVSVRLVDPLYHQAAERQAAARGSSVSYLCIPIRPDGRPF